MVANFQKCSDFERYSRPSPHCTGKVYQIPTVLTQSCFFQGYPAWPALVDDDPDTETFYWPDSDEESFQPEWYKLFFSWYFS